MIEVRKELDALKTAFSNSSAYKRYQTVRLELRNFPDKEKRLQEFRRKNYELQNSKEQIDLLGEMERLSAEYADLYKDPITMEYLAAEAALCKIYQQINKELIESIDFEAVLTDEARTKNV